MGAFLVSGSRCDRSRSRHIDRLRAPERCGAGEDGRALGSFRSADVGASGSVVLRRSERWRVRKCPGSRGDDPGGWLRTAMSRQLEVAGAVHGDRRSEAFGRINPSSRDLARLEGSIVRDGLAPLPGPSARGAESRAVQPSVGPAFASPAWRHVFVRSLRRCGHTPGGSRIRPHGRGSALRDQQCAGGTRRVRNGT